MPSGPPTTVPTSARHVLDTFFAARACPNTGWDNTICGTYQSIADAVNLRHSTAYSTSEIGWALTWLHQWGPDVAGAYVSKIGPGNHKTTVRFDAAGSPDVTVDGGVYMLIIDGVALPHEKQRILAEGLMEWCDYRHNSLRNDVIDLSMTRGCFPATDPANRRIRATFQATIRRNGDEMGNILTLKAELARLL